MESPLVLTVMKRLTTQTRDIKPRIHGIYPCLICLTDLIENVQLTLTDVFRHFYHYGIQSEYTFVRS